MKKKINAFTLTELLVAITISIILIIWMSRISLQNISEAQKVWIFYNKIRSNIETAINYSLIGKTVDNTLKVPKYWKVNINSNSLWTWMWTWSIIISYWSWTFTTHTGFSIKSPNFYSITNIKCSDLQNNNIDNETNIDLIIENWNISLSWCTNNNEKIIDFDILYKKYTKHININSVTNIIN
jgi:type II secretory pathway pseudopilin PulG